MKRRQYLTSVAAISAISTVGAVPASAQESQTISDPEGDDYGPGTYTYPTTDQLPVGCFDVTGVDIVSTDSAWEFTFQMGTVPNSFGSSSGFSVQAFQLYFHDPNAPDDAPATTEAREGAVSTFEEPYHYRRHVTGFGEAFEDAEGNSVGGDVSSSGNTSENTVTVPVPKGPFETDDVSELKVAILVFSQDGSGGVGGIRQNLAAEASDWTIGGVNEDAIDSAPRVMDLVAPDSVLDQQEALSYSAGSPPVIPLVPVANLVSGEAPSSGSPPTAAATADPGSVYGGEEVTLDASDATDPDGQTLSFQWTQTSGPEVSLSNASSAQATFTAPEVDAETTMEFEVEVSDPDGNAATASASVTVQFNAAPTADAGESVTASPGDSVTLDGSGSSDPEGGSLTYEWSQTGGPDVELSDSTAASPSFTAPDLDSTSTLTFELTVEDGQGKTATATVEVTVEVETTTTTMPTEEPTTDEPTTDEPTTESGDGDGGSDDTGSGFGPGFGVVSAAVGTAGGAAYAAKRVLGDEPAPEDE
ncbi:glucodextranase DOMON-like domain-containing protein [Halapricum salinum]|uniref:PKD/Chitinase domain-containing protein n=1 Tax=Halapricum salinum TaxID=1457250 RepID=A0A4D6HA60_9EURY|nr:glucodextranase DOMON-like domain-containing protein [Halapricum salinum]QCC50411.1 hypothetical protein DV733_03795 [Halapricum salinum]